MHLLKHFKELTVRPKNALELKGLILQLAVQGKLTANWRKENKDVEPASELLKRIQKEKEQLIKEKKIKKEKSLPPITKEAIPYELPVRWIWCRLGQSGYTQTGSTPPKKNPKNYGNFIPFIGPADISNKWMKYPVDGLSELGLSIGRLIPKNSLMMVCIGGSIGKCNVNKIDVSCNQQINTVTPISVPVSYVKSVCQSPYFQKKVLGKSSGSATPIINKGKWEVLPFPLPPLEEQKAIVEIVETLFKEVEQLEQLTIERIALKEKFVTSALNQLAINNTKKEWAFLQEHFKGFFNETSNIKKLREAVLQLAVQGKLTADWRANNPDTEDATVLLKRIQKEKTQLIKDKKIKKEKPLPFITKDEIPYELPDGWVWCRLNEVCEYIQRGKSPKYTEIPKIPVVSQKCVQWSGFDISRAKFITEESLDKYGEERFLQFGDLLWNSTGNGTIGRVISFPKSNFENVVADSHVTVVRSFKKYVLTDYLWIFTASPLIQNIVVGRVTGSTNQTELGTATVKLMEFSFPPVKEQIAIVQKVNSLMSLCDALEQQVQQSQEQSEQLMQSVLREVFEGKKELEEV